MDKAVNFLHQMNMIETRGKTMFIISKDKIYNFIAALDQLNLLKHHHNEFLFVILDTNSRHRNIDSFFDFGNHFSMVNLTYLIP